MPTTLQVLVTARPHWKTRAHSSAGKAAGEEQGSRRPAHFGRAHV
jgi:hypothetical protein